MKIAIFISGSGSLIPSFVEEAENDSFIDIDLVLADRKCSGLDRAFDFGLEITVFEEFGTDLADFLKKREIDMVCLAGFLGILPAEFIDAYPGLILNIHPALLPKYAGKGMYGDRVHKAVLESGDEQTGTTIHEVTADVDEGPIVWQKECKVFPEDDVASLRERVQTLEKEWYALTAYQTLKERLGY